MGGGLLFTVGDLKLRPGCCAALCCAVLTPGRWHRHHVMVPSCATHCSTGACVKIEGKRRAQAHGVADKEQMW
jgi:hypothetical protein